MYRVADSLHPVMNDTKWNELRLAMLELHPPPAWSTLVTNGHRSYPEREWFYHFRAGGYEDIVSVQIFADDAVHRELIRTALKAVHVPGAENAEGFVVFGYLEDAQEAEYL